MSDLWSLPGYDVLSPTGTSGLGETGTSGLGELWRARERATGDVVSLQRLRDGVDRAAVEQVRALTPVLRSLQTPHLVRLRAVVGDGADAVLVLDHPPGRSLARLLAERGAIEPGEVVTVAAPLASALALAHAPGVVHGDVSAEQVLLAADGMPLLAGLGLAALGPGGGGRGGPEEDVRALAALCHRMLTGAAGAAGTAGDVGRGDAGEDPSPLSELADRVPRALVAAVERGLDLDPASRPDAAAFAMLLRRAHPAAPVRLTGGPARGAAVGARVPVGERPAVAAAGPAARRAPSGGQVAAVAVVLLALVAAVGGWAWGRTGGDAPGELSRAAAAATSPEPDLPRAPVSPADPPPPALPAGPSPAASPVDPFPDWPAVLDELDTARAAALARADPSALHAVHAPSSPALALDSRLVEQLAAAGHRALGVRHSIRAVEVLDRREDRVRLRVVDVLPPHEVRDAAGAVVRRAAGRGDTASVVELARTPAGWRMVTITAP